MRIVQRRCKTNIQSVGISVDEKDVQIAIYAQYHQYHFVDVNQAPC